MKRSTRASAGPTRLIPLLLLALTLGFASCDGGVTGSDPGEDDGDNPPGNGANLAHSPPVEADGILEAVTWNLEWYGDHAYGEDNGNGPADEELQTRNIKQVMDSLKADLYAFQEVYSREAIEDLADLHEGYEGFVAGHISWIQKTGFVYNTNAVEFVGSGAIGEEKGQDFDNWVNGRYPLWFRFDYRWQGESVPVFAVVIHAKAGDGAEDYKRRRGAAQALYGYLKNEHPEAWILLLGDYNDDVDLSIHQDEPSPYRDFVNDPASFDVLTDTLSEQGLSSTTNPAYTDMIDHITVSDEFFEWYMEGSAEVYKDPQTWITSYGQTTSDHYPVWVRLDLRGYAGTLSE
ncbi:MAG: hypothetical protein U5K31_03565 [Balneolaceae bacterium]|nr:hypothetical protein [Balneolaceae bacterium]